MQADVEELVQGPLADHITRLQGAEGDEVALEAAFEQKESLHSLLLSLDPRYAFYYMAFLTAAGCVIAVNAATQKYLTS